MAKENKSMNIILMGPPAAGKGTQSELIVKEYDIPHISTGDMFRAAIANKTPLGVQAQGFISQGLLVPDEVTIGLVKERLAQKDCEKGFLLDGFPRTVPQAEALEQLLEELGKKLTASVLLVADDEVLIKRISSRRVCPKCGASYNLETKKPLVEGICDSCGSEIILRPDDRPESFKVRLDAYANQTFPLVAFYKEKGILKEVNALQDIADVFNDVKNVLSEE